MEPSRPAAALLHVKHWPWIARPGNCPFREAMGYFGDGNTAGFVTVATARFRPSAPQPRIDRLMQYIIAAAIAVVAALAEFTVAPYLRFGGATLHPVLVLGVSWAIAGGAEAGMAWAFVGGLALDILGQRPLGTSAFSMLIAIGIAVMIGGVLGRARMVAPVVATAITSVLYSLLLLAVTTALTNTPLPGTALDIVVPSAIYDALLALLVGPLAVAIVLRRLSEERVTW